jgi:predicted acylesterase/phospholipase RssA
MGIFHNDRPYRRSRHRAIILGGGAARGAYELGAWTILRKHGFEFDGFAGTSIGALNATLMAQNDYDLAVEVWETITLSDVLVLPKDLTPSDITRMSMKTFRGIYQEMRTRGGLDSTPLLKYIRKHTREDDLRRRGVDLGIVTFAVPQFRPLRLFLDEMEGGRLPEYLYASASFPLFKAAKIENQYFTDGGVNDNVPSVMMQDRGYRDLVIIDITSVGFVQKPKMENSRILYIKNTRPLPNLLDLHPRSLRYSRSMGELDTRRVLGELDGRSYYFDLSGRASRRASWEELPEDMKELLPDDVKRHHPMEIAVMEAAARAYRLEPLTAYTPAGLEEAIRLREEEIAREIATTAQKEDPVTPGTIGNVLMTFARDKMGNEELLQKHPPMFWLLAGRKLLPKYRERIEGGLAILYPELRSAVRLRELIPGIRRTP